MKEFLLMFAICIWFFTVVTFIGFLLSLLCNAIWVLWTIVLLFTVTSLCIATWFYFYCRGKDEQM